MDLLKLVHYFTVIVDERHFGQAARRLGMTQPPLSQGLARLERELGVRLLDRGPLGVNLTEAGVALLPHANRLLSAERDLRDAALATAPCRAGLRIGVVAQLPAGVSAALAETCGAALPDVPVSLSTASTVAVAKALAAGRFHLGVVVHPAVVGDLVGGAVVRLGTSLLVPRPLVPPPGQARRLRDVLRLPLALPPREHAPAAHDLLVETLHEHGVTVGSVTVEDERAALALVATGQACALTADRRLTAAGVARIAVPGEVLPLRVRVLWAQGGGSRRLLHSLGEQLTAALVEAADLVGSAS